MFLRKKKKKKKKKSSREMEISRAGHFTCSGIFFLRKEEEGSQRLKEMGQKKAVGSPTKKSKPVFEFRLQLLQYQEKCCLLGQIAQEQRQRISQRREILNLINER